VRCDQPSLLQLLSPSCCHARKSVLEAKSSFALDDVRTDLCSCWVKALKKHIRMDTP
jgi:hypothetical protein